MSRLRTTMRCTRCPMHGGHNDRFDARWARLGRPARETRSVRAATTGRKAAMLTAVWRRKGRRLGNLTGGDSGFRSRRRVWTAMVARSDRGTALRHTCEAGEASDRGCRGGCMRRGDGRRCSAGRDHVFIPAPTASSSATPLGQ
jgi:hypothetical protein